MNSGEFGQKNPRRTGGLPGKISMEIYFLTYVVV
jgi:hypothetical protein